MKSYVYHSATATAHALIEHLIAMMEREPEKTFYFAFSGVSLIGNKDMKLDRNVLSGNLHIKEGRMITPEDKDMCVISEELAKQNNLKIGDKISFNDYHDTENSKVSEAEIVGIYQVDQKMSPLMQGDTYRSENVIFTDLRFPEKAEGETSPLYERAYFKVEDVEA